MSTINFPNSFRVSNHQIVDKKNTSTELLFKLSHLNANFALTQGYLNSAFNMSRKATKRKCNALNDELNTHVN